MRDFNQRPTTDQAPDELEFMFGPGVFHRLAALPASMLYRIGQISDDSSMGSDAKALVEIVVNCVEPAERELMWSILRGDPWNPDLAEGGVISSEPEPSIDQLQEMVDWLVASATGRPFDQPQPSATSSATPELGTPSTPASASPAAVR